MTSEENHHSTRVDCDIGRQIGCQTFCCRLLVRLKDHELPTSTNGRPVPSYIEKDPQDGWCIHLDRKTKICRIWSERPEACREYSCNDDFKLQIVLREGITSVAELAKRSAVAYIPKETFRRIPLVKVDDAED